MNCETIAVKATLRYLRGKGLDASAAANEINVVGSSVIVKKHVT